MRILVNFVNPPFTQYLQIFKFRVFSSDCHSAGLFTFGRLDSAHRDRQPEIREQRNFRHPRKLPGTTQSGSSTPIQFCRFQPIIKICLPHWNKHLLIPFEAFLILWLFKTKLTFFREFALLWIAGDRLGRLHDGGRPEVVSADWQFSQKMFLSHRRRWRNHRVSCSVFNLTQSKIILEKTCLFQNLLFCCSFPECY